MAAPPPSPPTSSLPPMADEQNRASVVGEKFVRTVVDLMVNPLLREQLFQCLREGEHELLNSVWKRLTSHLDPAIDLYAVRDDLVFEAEVVADVTRVTLKEEWFVKEPSKDCIQQKGDKGDRSGERGDGRSKTIKLETLALHEKVEKTDLVRVTSDWVDPLLGRELEPALEGSMGSRSDRAGESVAGAKRVIVLDDLDEYLCSSKGGSHPTTATMVVESAEVCGSNVSSTVMHGGKKGAEQKDKNVAVADAQQAMTSCPSPVRCIASEGIAQGADWDVNHINLLVEQGRSKGGTQPVRSIASEGNFQELDALALAVTTVVDDRETELEFQPPVAGVGLDKYIAAALSARSSSNKGSKSGGVRRPLGGRADPAMSCDDPFPPLSRSASGLGLGGDSASSRDPLCVDLNRLLAGRENVVLKAPVGEANKFSWTELLRSNKPGNVCVDLHYVEPSIIDGEACAVFSLEEEAENLKQWQNTLLCYVVGKSPSYYQFIKAMQRQWNPPGGLEMFSRENGIFYCMFGSESDMKKVIKDGPWYMDGKLVVVKKFSGETNCEEEMLSSIPIWVKLPCLPVQWWSIEGVSKVVSPLGHPLYFDLTSASKSRIGYARCCVEVAMEKNLPSSVLCVGGDKIKKRQNITYDWVPKRCSACKEFGHNVAECGSSQPKQQQDMNDGWNNIKKTGKVQQIYRPKEKSQIVEVEGQRKTNTQKGGGVIGKIKQDMLIGGSKGAIYKTNIFNSRMGTIKATSTNPYHLLVNMEEGDTGDKRDGGNKENHKYFCSDDEADGVAVISPRMESHVAHELNKMEGLEITCVEEEGKEMTLVPDPCTTIKGVEAEVFESRAAEEDTHEREAKGSDELVLVIPSTLGNYEMAGTSLGNKESGDESQESDSEKDEEKLIQNDGKQPAACGRPPMLTVSNPNYKGDEGSKETKKVKKRPAPAPERPDGSRTTRHSFKVG